VSEARPKGSKPEAERAESGDGSWGMGSQLAGLGSAVSSPSTVRGGVPVAKGFLAF